MAKPGLERVSALISHETCNRSPAEFLDRRGDLPRIADFDDPRWPPVELPATLEVEQNERLVELQRPGHAARSLADREESVSSDPFARLRSPIPPRSARGRWSFPNRGACDRRRPL